MKLRTHKKRLARYWRKMRIVRKGIRGLHDRWTWEAQHLKPRDKDEEWLYYRHTGQ